MNNIGTLYLAEIKKVFSKKSVWLTLIIGTALVCMAIASNAFFETYDYPDGSKMSGLQFYKLESEECSKLSGRTIDDEFLNEVRGTITDFALKKDYLTEKQLAGLNKSIEKPARMDTEDGFIYQNTPMVALDSAAEQLGISDCWYFLQDTLDDNQNVLTVTAKEFNKSFADGIDTPMVYTYQQGYDIFIESAWICVWLLFLLITLSLAGIFAYDRQTKMDALIVSSRNGRRPIATAKVLAGFTVAVIETLVVFGAVLAVCIGIYSGQGWNGPIQMFVPGTAWNATAGQIVSTYLVIIMVMGILFASATMMLSRFCGGAQTLGIQMGVLMLGFFNLPFKNLLSRLWDLRPTTFLTMGILSNEDRFSFGLAGLNCVEMAIVLYLIATIACMAVTVASYMKYQVKNT
ncbi:MAG: hypothetical protein KBS56_05790 [Clostridiales bacterium]|nr:hypothetical protein [Candidatus Crickella equi]